MCVLNNLSRYNYQIPSSEPIQNKPESNIPSTQEKTSILNQKTYDIFNGKTPPNKTHFDPVESAFPNLPENNIKPSSGVESLQKIEDLKISKSSGLEENESGESIKSLKDKLTKLGFKVPKNDVFDNETKKAIETIQNTFSLVGKDSPNFGKAGKETIEKIDSLAKTFSGNAIPESMEGRKLSSAGARIAGNKPSRGRCYTGVWAAIQQTNLDKKGINPPASNPARDFGEWALKDGKKNMGRVMPFLDPNGKLVGLNPGDIIVYERGVQGHHPKYGHIEIYGKGKNFYSDFNSGETGYNQIVTGLKNGQVQKGLINIFRLKNSTPVSEK